MRMRLSRELSAVVTADERVGRTTKRRTGSLPLDAPPAKSDATGEESSWGNGGEKLRTVGDALIA